MIQLNNVSVTYPVFHSDKAKTLRGLLKSTSFLRSKVKTDGVIHVKALTDVSFCVQRGERVGVIGINGAGKTTLLKTIAGIYKPTEGTINIEGSARGFFNIGAGLDIHASGYRNIKSMSFFYTRNLDLIDQTIPDIIEFSELKEFIYLPISTYSAGMLARLMVSVAIHYDAENLLFDEGLGAGDSQFHEKLSKRIFKMVEDSRSFVLASHSFVLMKQYCTKALLLNNGKAENFGDIDDVIKNYISLTDGKKIL